MGVAPAPAPDHPGRGCGEIRAIVVARSGTWLAYQSKTHSHRFPDRVCLDPAYPPSATASRPAGMSLNAPTAA